MQPQFVARHISTKNAVALVLSFAAGCVDAIGYVAIYKIFAANMTGNTVQLARTSVQTDLAEAAKAAAVLAAFLLGSLIGRSIIEIGSRTKVRSIASATLLLEAALIAAVVPLGGSHPDRSGAVLGLFALLAAAMGIQTATLTGIGPLTVHTTFVTGMVNKTAQLISRIMFRAYDLRRSASANAAGRRDQKDEVEMTLFLSGVWLCYIVGAAAGTWSFAFLGLRTLFIAVALLAIALITDQFRPLSVLEEIEQSEG